MGFNVGDYVAFHADVSLGVKLASIEVAKIKRVYRANNYSSGYRLDCECVKGSGTGSTYHPNGNHYGAERIKQPEIIMVGTTFTVSDKAAHIISYTPTVVKTVVATPKTTGLPPVSFPKQADLLMLLALE